MDQTKRLLNKVGLGIAFTIALYSTFNQITGVDAKELMPEGKEISNHLLEGHFGSDSGIALGKVTNTYSPETMISGVDIQKPATVEETLDLSSLEKVNVLATGYTAGIESTGKTPSSPTYGITSSGVKVKRDLYSTIAADTRVFPFGTILFIPGYGYGVVADRGGAIKESRIDLYFETVEDVYSQWGKKHLDVYIVKKGDGKLDEATLQALNENEAVQVFRTQFTKQ